MNGAYYQNAIMQGFEIVAVAPESMKNFDSAIFWADDGEMFTFSRNLGLMERGKHDFTAHFEKLLQEGYTLTARGGF